MGMYDEFEILNYYHSVCGHSFTKDWQTKSLMECLETYKIGDDIRRPEWRDDVFADYRHSVFELHTSCPKCEQWLSEYGQIKDFIYVGLYPYSQRSHFDKCPWCQQKL